LEDEEEDISSYCSAVKDDRILETERGSTRLHPVENSLWKTIRTCLKTDSRMK
jgi:hypothetical protein